MNALIDDVRRIREHPLVPRDIPIYGYYYDVKTGRLADVAKATAAGRSPGLVGRIAGLGISPRDSRGFA